MAPPNELHQALAILRPKDFEKDVPHEDLANYLRTVFKDANLIANTVPPPAGGDPYASSTKSGMAPNEASSADEIVASSTRPPEKPADIVKLAQGWGKAQKTNPRDNPLGINVFKMAGHDRYGAWFARTSIHEGLGFAKWKACMKKEFDESLAVQGGPGEGNIRGIGGDQRLERKVVEGVGKLEVFQLSAQFPGPTAPREFITMLLTTEDGVEYPTADSAVDYKPRTYLVVSIPVTHKDAPPRSGLVLGQYESVEMIREIPLSIDEGSAESNPVEWTMITRSDPGGGIPRFMVERGTPSSIIGDASKFLNWACKQDETAEVEDGLAAEAKEQLEEPQEEQVKPEEAIPIPESTSIPGTDGRKKSLESAASVASPPANHHRDSAAILSLTNVAEKYSPKVNRKSEATVAAVTDSNPSLADTQRSRSREASPARSDVSSSSFLSFASAHEYESGRVPGRVPSNAYSLPPPSHRRSRNLSESSSDTPRTESGDPDSQLSIERSDTLGPDKARYDRELGKLAARREEIESRYAKARETETKRREEANAKESKDAAKAQDRLDRDLRKQEQRYKREMEKLETRREKETRKLEEKRKKASDKDEKTRYRRERDEARQRADVLEKENTLLKQSLGDLQRENTALVARMGRMEGGQALLKKVREEMGDSKARDRSRSLTGASRQGSWVSEKAGSGSPVSGERAKS